MLTARFLLCHRHQSSECGPSFAAWRGFVSPLRRSPTISSCQFGEHRIWWDVEAATEEQALAWLPSYVADRTQVIRIGELEIP
jgi:hypothetical protein